MNGTARSLVLFDIDGTLMRGAGPHHKLALIEGVRRVTGCDVTLDGVATAGSLDRDLIAGMLRAQGRSERAIRDVLRRAMRECQERYLESCPADLTPFLCPDVRQTLEALRAGNVAMGVVSGNLAAIGWRKLELAGVRHFFAFGAFAEDGRSRTRLAQVAYWRALRQQIVRKGSRVSLIGDHPNDVEAARRNGFQSIAVASGVVSREELAASRPDILLDRLGQLELARI
ncbi:MAG TPA: HAD family hydrolase [Bryobacteraceae bacterium]|jgi:phosphoglycolate phosphatase-like HAD superfamily hydrolase|nr:HAD family hydrolase [Bryobacteraceae bacterium]